MVKSDSKWFTFFSGHQKRDDLADAYLTNCYYIDREFKINKFAPKTKTKKETKTKANPEIGDEGDDDGVIPESVYIKDSDEDEKDDMDGKEDKFSKLFPDLFGEQINIDICMGFGEGGNGEEGGNEEEEEVKEKKPFKKFYKNYYNKNQYQNKTPKYESKTTLIPNKKPTAKKAAAVSINEIAKMVPKKKVIGGLDNFFA